MRHLADLAHAGISIWPLAADEELAATLALLDGAAAAVWMRGGRPRLVYDCTTSAYWITAST
jgi:hypothetical protein